MRYFTKEWYREMQVAGFLVFPETLEEWEESIAYYLEEGIDYRENDRRNLLDMKEDLLAFLPDTFHPYIHNGTLNSEFPSPALRQMTDKWQQDYEKRMEKLAEEYNQHYEATKHKLSKHAIKLVENSLHDAVILSFEKLEEHFVIILDCSGGFHYFTHVKLTFIGVKEVHVPEDLKDAWWLYDEIYPSDSGFELHVLLDCPLQEMKIVAEDVKIEEL